MKTKQLLSRAFCASMFAAGLTLASSEVFAQVKVGDNPTTINAGSVLELESTNRGLLMPRISLTNTTTWGLGGTATAGMHVYNTNTSITSTNSSYPTLAAKKGEYYWDGTGWVALATPVKSTAITSFTQTGPKTIDMATSPTNAGGFFCGGQAIGAPIPACATDLGRDASFAVTNSTNDVIIDVTGLYTAGITSTPAGPLQYFLLMYIDKTTPGVFELVEQYFIQTGSSPCTGGAMNMKAVLKNLPERNYNVKLYQMNWYNGGAPAKIGIGGASTPGCGQNDFAQQRMIVMVSQ